MRNLFFGNLQHMIKVSISSVIVCCLAGSLACVSSAYSADAKAEKSATTLDSDARKWAGIDGTRYGDSIRKTSRITYPDAGNVPQLTCNLVGDMRTDMVFLDQKNRQIHIVDHIPYGSDEYDIERSIKDQPGAVHIDLPSGEGSWHIACVKKVRGENPVLAVANKNKVYVSAVDSLVDGQAFPTDATYTFGSDVLSIAPLTSGVDTPGMIVAAHNKVFAFERIKSGEQAEKSASNFWNIGSSTSVTVAPLNYALGEELTIGVGVAEENKVYAISMENASGEAADEGVVVQASGGSFGASLVAIGDVNGDDINDYAVGAPGANNNAGAVAVIYGSTMTTGMITVDVSSTSDLSVRQGKDQAGTLIRQAHRGRIGTSLAYVAQYDAHNPGALVISRPEDEEHPGAVVVSEKALNKNWNTGTGLASIPANQSVILASEEGGDGDGGFYVGSIPPADSDIDLYGIYTGDSKGKVDVWTVDMRRQNETTAPVEPRYPAPPAPSAEPAYKTLDENDRKSWLGGFTTGFGGAITRGRCDVTGDGKPDLISGSAIRSEYKFDPYYEDSTSTHGWVFNVTGAIDIVPGGTPGGNIENNGHTITILGPKKTQDPAADAAAGFSVACLGDVNGDGSDDIAASSVTMGRIWVIYGGKDLHRTDLNNLDSSRGYIVDMPYQMGAAGYQVTRVGDVDHDTFADLGFVVANTPLAMGDRSQSYGTAFIVKGNAEGRNIDLKDLEKNSSDVIWRVNTPKGHTLNAFASVGDVNADGLTDYVLADFNSFTDKGTVPGSAWVVYGNARFENVDLDNNIPGYELVMSDDASYRLGAGNSIAPAGDVNNDGIGDFVIGFDGGSIQHQTKGGVVFVPGTKKTIATRNISPRDRAKTDEDIRIITGASVGSSFGWAVDTLPVSHENPQGLLAVGAGGQGDNGAAYILQLKDFPQGITSIDELGEKVTTIESSAERSRFGRSVAFIGDYLGASTLTIGGDGVIDNPSIGEEGYAHSAHILAITAAKVTPEQSSTNGSQQMGGSRLKPNVTNNTIKQADISLEAKGGVKAGVSHLPSTGIHAGLMMICVCCACLAAGGFASKRWSFSRVESAHSFQSKNKR